MPSLQPRAITRAELRDQIENDLATTDLFQATPVLLQPLAHGKAYERLPADQKTQLPGNPDMLVDLVKEKPVLDYIIDWVGVRALIRARRIRGGDPLELASEAVYRTYAFILGDSDGPGPNGRRMCVRPMSELVAEGRLKTFGDLAQKIKGIAHGRPFREYQEQLRQRPNHRQVEDWLINFDPRTETDTDAMELFRVLIVRAFLDFLRGRCVRLRKRLVKLPAGTSLDRADLEAKLVKHKAEILYTRANLTGLSCTRAEIAKHLGADPDEMSAAQTYATRTLLSWLEGGLVYFLEKSGVDAYQVAREYGLPASIVDDLLSRDD